MNTKMKLGLYLLCAIFSGTASVEAAPVKANLQVSSQLNAKALIANEPSVELESINETVGFDGAAKTDDGRILVFAELFEQPAALIYGELRSNRLPAASRTRSQLNRIRAEQNALVATLTSAPINAREVYRVQKSLNGFALAIDSKQLSALTKLRGVKRVLPLIPEFPTNSTSVPFIGTPKIWANTIGLPAGADGTGIRIGIIDTGLDYLHAQFGGTGLLADYQGEATDTANFTTLGTAASGSFPTAKVVNGFDFAGDLYTGTNAPTPDPNPMDCNGHGTHVAGTASGFGVTTLNATFPGPYDANTATYSALKMGPGTAPLASLYGLRVFGCGGSTTLTVLAIDWAIDPNNDDDFSDGLHVINMSLGSNFGGATTATAAASDNAAVAGVVVVASAGNANDTFFISGSPGSGNRVIATAASVDDGVPASSITVNSPAPIAGNYLGGSAVYGPAASGQTANSVIAVDATTPAACGALTSDGCCVLSNAAAVAGNICVVDRGTCSFKTKTLNCLNAGAIGVVVVDNAPGSPPPGLGDDATIVTPITIPSMRVTLVEGTLIKNTINATPPVNITMNSASGADTLASFSSRGPRRILGSALRLKPDVAAPGVNISSSQTGKTCTGTAPSTGCQVPNATGFLPDSQVLTISGTSMASPHMAGILGLLRQLNPTWTVEELKALAMNYAIRDVTLFQNATPPRFGPSRIGAGRTDVEKTALGDVIAYNADDPGVVSVTFDSEVSGVVTRSKKVRVVNRSNSVKTFDLAIDTVVNSPGVAFSIPGSSTVSVPANGSTEFFVQMDADSNNMEHSRDPSLFATQGVQANYGDQPRNFLTEEGGYLTFSQAASLKFRVPIYMAQKPAANMQASDTLTTGGSPTGSTSVFVTGSDLCTGTLGAGPSCTGVFPTDVESLVTPLELQVSSPLNPTSALEFADIQYAGVSFLPGAGSPSLTNDVVFFGVSSWGNWSTPNEVAYNICIDNNEDGLYDKIVINTSPASFVANAPLNDNFVRVVRDNVANTSSILGTASSVNLVPPTAVDTSLHLSNVMLLGASPSQLGFTSLADTNFRYKIVTCPAGNSGCARTTTGDRCAPAPGTFFDIAEGPFTYNWGAQGLNFGGNFLDDDLNGAAMPVTWNTANMTANGSLGALFLHHHNRDGMRAEVAVLEGTLSADLALSKTLLPLVPRLGNQFTITVTVTNNGANPSTGVVVSEPLPPGYVYVSDNSAGAYASATGLWTVGTLASGASATLSIVLSAETAIEACAATTVFSTTLDTNMTNNYISTCLRTPATDDVFANGFED